jgi:tetraprenyl-beta-curcumene synthase
MPRRIAGRRAALGTAFADAAGKYWLNIFPRVCKEIERWRGRAQQIPDSALRTLALHAQETEQGNLEGAAAFAILAPREHRAGIVRAVVAFQAAYDYVDALVEQPSSHPALNGRHLHRALLTALDLDAPHPDYYAYHSRCQDDGYLKDLVDTCRTTCAALPSYSSAAAPALRAAKRMVVYQSLNHADDLNGRQNALARWALREAPPAAHLRWWEIAAGSASSLVVFALIATAAQPAVCADETKAIEDAYFPWVGALHVLLDSLVDRAEDADVGQHSLIGHYASSTEAARRLKLIAAHAVESAGQLSEGTKHSMILAAMTSFYLSAPEASTNWARQPKREVLATMGNMAKPTMMLLGARRATNRLAPFVARKTKILRKFRLVP